MFEIKKATRSQVKLKIGVFGVSGSGKTMGSLLIAEGLVGTLSKVAVIDTENGSGALYSHLGEYLHLDLRPPFDPRRYVEAIKTIETKCPEVECIIIDSISHEWEGTGGCLSLQEKFGGRYQDWAKVTPLHQEFIDAILQSRCHIIVCGRTKIDYSMTKDNQNKTKVEKLGMKVVSREGFDYELTIAFKVDENHLAMVDKDRTDLFKNMTPRLLDKSIGEAIRKWNESVAVKLYDFQDLVTVFGNMPEELQAKVKTDYGALLAKAKDKENPMDEKELHSFVIKLKGLTNG